MADDVRVVIFSLLVHHWWAHLVHCSNLNGMNSSCWAINSLHFPCVSKQQLNTMQNRNLLVPNTQTGNAVIAISGHSLKLLASNTSEFTHQNLNYTKTLREMFVIFSSQLWKTRNDFVYVGFKKSIIGCFSKCSFKTWINKLHCCTYIENQMEKQFKNEFFNHFIVYTPQLPIIQLLFISSLRSNLVDISFRNCG